MTNTLTRKQMFAYISDSTDDPIIIEFCKNEIIKLSKPRQKKFNVEAACFAQSVYNMLSLRDDPMTAKDVANETGVSVQKASAAMRRLVKEGRVIKLDTDKKSAPAAYVINVEAVEAVEALEALD